MLSAAIIVKNEAKELERCLNSFKDYVDEIIVVSNAPATKAIKKVVDGISNGKLYERKWNNNFADARNYSFSKCSGDVIFWVDVDDVVLNAKHLPKLAELITENKADWVSLEYLYEKDEQGRVLMRHWKPRLVRKGSGIWKCAVHENFEQIEQVNNFKSDEVIIDHRVEGDHREKSAVRNLEILLAEVQEKGDDADPRTLYYLGNTLMAMEQFKDAAHFYSKHIEKCGWAEEKYFSMHYLAHCLSYIDRNEEAINVALESTKIFPQWSLAFYDIAEFYSQMGDFPKVIEWTELGLVKNTPNPADYFINDLDYDLHPQARLAHAYFMLGNYAEALSLAQRLIAKYPQDEKMKELYSLCKDANKIESFVKSFINVAEVFSAHDRISATKLFDILPNSLSTDSRIQQARSMIVPPKNWEKGSVVFYCHSGLEDWAAPSLLTGIGGSEAAVIHMSNELTKLGYKVTVYCKCGDMAGEYEGVEYKPYYFFNPKDIFDTLVIWRYPALLETPLTANKKLLWLHDIVSDQMFNQRILDNVDKVIFLSKWHRNNAPSVPDEKIFYSNNGIDPDLFKEAQPKRPYSMVYTSSYDRGAFCLGLDIFPIIKKAIPEATLDIAYGTGNLEKQMKDFPHLKEIYDKMQEVFKLPGVTHHGRISHKRVAQLQSSSILHIYPTEFGETNNISSQMAQAGGTFVLTTTQSGATPEYIRFGEALEGEGIYSDKMFQEQFAKRAIELLKSPATITEEERQNIIDEFSWESTANSWEGLINDKGSIS